MQHLGRRRFHNNKKVETVFRERFWRQEHDYYLDEIFKLMAVLDKHIKGLEDYVA
jgi:hypothetical protein